MSASFSMSSKNHQILWMELSGVMLCFCETCDIRWSFGIDYDLENPLKNQIVKTHPKKENEGKIMSDNDNIFIEDSDDANNKKETKFTSYEDQGFEVSQYKGIPIVVGDPYVKRWKWLPKWIPYNKVLPISISKVYLINAENMGYKTIRGNRLCKKCNGESFYIIKTVDLDEYQCINCGNIQKKEP